MFVFAIWGKAINGMPTVRETLQLLQAHDWSGSVEAELICRARVVHVVRSRDESLVRGGRVEICFGCGLSCGRSLAM